MGPREAASSRAWYLVLASWSRGVCDCGKHRYGKAVFQMYCFRGCDWPLVWACLMPLSVPTVAVGVFVFLRVSR